MEIPTFVNTAITDLNECKTFDDFLKFYKKRHPTSLDTCKIIVSKQKEMTLEDHKKLFDFCPFYYEDLPKELKEDNNIIQDFVYYCERNKGYSTKIDDKYNLLPENKKTIKLLAKMRLQSIRYNIYSECYLYKNFSKMDNETRNNVYEKVFSILDEDTRKEIQNNPDADILTFLNEFFIHLKLKIYKY